MPSESTNRTWRVRTAPYVRPTGPAISLSRRARQAKAKQPLKKPPRPRLPPGVYVIPRPGTMGEGAAAVPHVRPPPTHRVEPNPDNASLNNPMDDGPREIHVQIPMAPPPRRRRRGTKIKRIVTAKKQRLYDMWEEVLPKLRGPLLAFMDGQEPPLHRPCTKERCCDTLREVILVDWDRYTKVNFLCCPHQPLAAQLVARGYFPSAPSAGQYAFSLKLLDFYYHLWFHSADSATAAAAALTGFHADQGYVLKNKKGDKLAEGYRKELQYAIQWYDILRSSIEHEVYDVVNKEREWQQAWENLATEQNASAEPPPGPPTPSVSPPPQTAQGSSPDPAAAAESVSADHQFTPLAAGPSRAEQSAAAATNVEARTSPSAYLVSCCPACFNEQTYGRGLDEGCDFHVAGDANFGQRHDVKAGQCPFFKYKPVFQLNTSRVEAMEAKLQEAGKKPPRSYHSVVPEDDLDACEESHTAGTASKEKVKGDKFDDTGLFALICRHGHPLCFANIADAGEGQKYMLASLEWLSGELPPTATVAAFYDVGCMTDRTRRRYDVLPQGFSDRLVFVTSAMHAYAHQWTCQLVFSPRMKRGMGLTDGEGVERLWSALRMLISKLRSVSRRRRLVLLDRQLQRLSRRMNAGLAKLIRRRRSFARKQSEKAKKIIVKSGFSKEYLEQQWELQRAAELSVRSHPTKKLKKALESVLQLQEQIEAIDETIQSTEASVGGGRTREATTAINRCIRKLKASQAELTSEAQALYSTLNIDQKFDEIRGLGLQFTAVLLQAFEAKRTCQRLLRRRYQEWAILDTAKGGKGIPVGTTIHERTVNAMKKRNPTITRALKVYNDLCAKLQTLRPAGSAFPLPEPLAFDLKHLRNNDALMRDVYISGTIEDAPAWLVDSDVRKAIRAMQVVDRCDEELRRLEREGGNLVQWHEDQIQAVESAHRRPANAALRPFLKRELDELTRMDLRGCRRSSPSIARDLPHLAPATQPSSPPAPPDAAPAPRRVRFASHASVREFEVCSSAPDDTDESDNEYDSSDDLEEMDVMRAASSERGSRWVDDALSKDGAEDSGSESEADSDQDEPLDPAPQTAPSRNLTALPFVPTEASFLHEWEELDELAAAADDVLPADDTTIAPHADFPALVVDPSSWARLVTPGRWLNDEAINAGVSALAAEYPSLLNLIGAVSSYEIARFKNGMGADDLYSLAQRARPWAREIVIVPINEENTHWVLAVVWPKYGYIELFDSLGRSGWAEKHAQMVFGYFRTVTAHAQSLDPTIQSLPDVWKYLPMVDRASQSNGYDCGVWVLATVCAILNGKRCTSLGEEDMPHVRKALSALFCKYERISVV